MGQTTGASLAVPPAVRAEHAELHRVLNQARHESGPVGEAAAAVAKLLHRHFLVEEQVALPSLGALKLLSEGGLPDDVDAVIALSQKLKDQLPGMIAEHHRIVKALDSLVAAARATGQREYVSFAEQLAVHAALEEEVLYPAAILVGIYLKLVTQR